jgi:hypothetical protein
MKKVFLGGTCNGSSWRDYFMRLLTIYWFNPVVDVWTPECMTKELEEREGCDYCLYVITPEGEGFSSIAEVIDDSNKRPEKTIFCFTDRGSGSTPNATFTKHQIKSLEQVARMVEENGGKVFSNLSDVAFYLNSDERGVKEPEPKFIDIEEEYRIFAIDGGYLLGMIKNDGQWVYEGEENISLTADELEAIVSKVKLLNGKDKTI